MRVSPLFVLLGCRPGTSTEASGPGTVELACALDASNALRAHCTVTATPPAPVTLTWGPSSDPARESWVVPQGETEATLLWLEPRAVHEITATHAGGGEATASVETGELPLDVQIDYRPTGTSSVERLLFESRCEDSSTVVIASTAGATEWYQEFSPDEPDAEVLSTMMTDRGTVVALGGGGDPVDWIREYDLAGNLVFEATEFPELLHHDVFERDQVYYVLFHEDYPHTDGRVYKLDGFYIVDASANIVGTWRLLDHIDTKQLESAPGASPVDFSHANSIHADENGDVLVSFRHMSALAKVRGDWTAPDFGEVIWWLGGDPGAPNPNSDLDITSSAGIVGGFRRQHHAVRVGDRLTVFDNQPDDVNSRLLSMTVDEAGGAVDIDEVYVLDRHCDFQGSYYPLPNGNALGSCAALGKVYEFLQGAAKPHYTMSAQCFLGEADAVFRMTPVDAPLAALGW